jgi:DNA-binding GntR family transcriptional regulator
MILDRIGAKVYPVESAAGWARRGEPMESAKRVIDSLRQDILSGRVGQGERLVEIELAKRYRCGRSSVRSALVALEKEGLIDRRANRGATVRRISLAEAIQITEARASLEVLVARHAARHASADERSDLRSIVRTMRATVAAGDYARYSDLNGTLHLRLAEVSRHEVASDLINNLRNRAAHLRFQLALIPGRPQQSMEEHQAIVDAIVRGDEAAAATAMERHIASVLDVLRHWDAMRMAVL